MLRKNHSHPSTPGQPLHHLKDGFWEETAVYQHDDGSKVVRKANKPCATPGPWAMRALRKEICYLGKAVKGFPPLLRSWDHQDATGTHVGFEIPYYEHHHSLAERITLGTASQTDADRFQQMLATLILNHVHVPCTDGPNLSTHVEDVLTSAADQLGSLVPFQALVHAPHITINSDPYPGLQALIDRALETGLFSAMDCAPYVQLHGDLILENILCHKDDHDHVEELILIDPVSVAGISHGPALMDLVKYESYATGELLAVRSDWLQAGPSADGYALAIEHSHPQLQAFRSVDWCAGFRSAFEDHHGPNDLRLYALLEAYYALVMAVNTSGTQQWARTLLGIQALHEALTGPC